MRIKPLFKNLTLQNKLIISFSFLFVIIFITLIIIFRLQLSDKLFNGYQETSLSLANSIATSSLNSLFIYDYNTIQKNIDNLAEIEGLCYIIIYDLNNKPIASEYYEAKYKNLNEILIEDSNKSIDSVIIREKKIYHEGEEAELMELLVPIKYKDQIWGKVKLAVSLDSIYEFIRNLEIVFLFIGLCAIVVVVIGSRYLSKIVFEPLNKMIDATQKVAEGDLNIKIETDNENEINTFAKNFNRMVVELKNSREEIERWGRELEKKVQERTLQLEKSEKALLNILMDIKEANEKLKASEERYRKFFEDDLTGDFITTHDGKIIECNPAFARILGYSSVEEVKKIDASQIYPSPEARDEFLKILKKHKRLYNYEIELKKKDGSPLFIIENVFAELDEQGEIKSIRGYLFDNTERKKLEEKLLHSQKMEAIGTLAGGIAHDFNNVMGIVLGVLDMISMKVKSEEVEKLLDMGKKAIERGAGVAKQLLLFARAEKGKFASVRFSIVLKEVVSILRHTFPKNIDIEVVLKARNENVYADSTQLHIVLLNLCVNARDAMPNGGKITITIYNVNKSEILEKYPKANKDEYLVLEVTDTGVGMTKEIKSRIFDPFFTTKDIGKGTGLGLSIVYGIVNSHNAFINVESEPGKGSTFSIFFPVMETEEVKPDVLQENVNLKGTETILLVEDEQYLLFNIKNLLQDFGYNVITASNGYEGLRVFMENYEKIDLVITDLGLPKLTGDELFKEIIKVKPEILTIIMTGYIELERRSELYKLGIKEILAKPLHFDQLLKVIRDTFDLAKN